MPRLVDERIVENFRDLHYQMQQSVYYLKEKVKTSDVERYSDKYRPKQPSDHKGKLQSIATAPGFFPLELRGLCAGSSALLPPRVDLASMQDAGKRFDMKALDRLEKDEGAKAASAAYADSDDETAKPAEEYSENEAEEETDYNLSYFDYEEDLDYDGGGDTIYAGDGGEDNFY